MTGTERPNGPEPSVGELLSTLSEQTARLVRDEVRLAQIEFASKARRTGIGVGLLGAAGVIALFAVGGLVAAAILALALVLPGWAAALIAAGGLLAVAGGVALIGRRDVTAAAPPAPTETIRQAREDLSVIKQGMHK